MRKVEYFDKLDMTLEEVWVTIQPLFDQFYYVNGDEYQPTLEELVDFFVNESYERMALEPEER